MLTIFSERLDEFPLPSERLEDYREKHKEILAVAGTRGTYVCAMPDEYDYPDTPLIAVNKFGARDWRVVCWNCGPTSNAFVPLGHGIRFPSRHEALDFLAWFLVYAEY